MKRHVRCQDDNRTCRIGGQDIETSLRKFKSDGRGFKIVRASLKGACLAERWLSAGTLFAEGRVNSGNRKMEELKKKIKRTIKDRRLKL